MNHCIDAKLELGFLSVKMTIIGVLLCSYHEVGQGYSLPPG